MIKKILLSLLISFFTLSLLIGITSYWAYQQIEQYVNAPLMLTKAEELQVKSGMTITAVINQLAAKNIINNNWKIKIFLKLHPELTRIQAGFYEITKGQSFNQFLLALHNGKQKIFSVTLIEGKTIKEWQQELAKAPHLVLSDGSFANVLKNENDNDPVEGKFFPDTYHYTAGQNGELLLTQSYLAMKKTIDEAWKNRAKDSPLNSPYELLILASIVEKETGKSSERPLVAAVFSNRLKKRMRLQTDPTVIYGMGERYKGNITRKDLREKTAFNTYRINGLPPTPIAAPSKASILAAANPAHVKYLYFVSRNDGSHIFSYTLNEHNRAVNKYQRKFK